MSQREQLEMAIKKIQERRIRDVEIPFPDRRDDVPGPGDSIVAEAYLTMLPKRKSITDICREKGIPVPSGPGGREPTLRERIALFVRLGLDSAGPEQKGNVDV